MKKILFHFLFEKWKVKWKSDSLISRMKSEMQMPWDRDREWKVKWKCIEIEIESEKWNENASRSRSRSEISREFSRNSWESGIFSYLPTVRFQMSLKIAYLSECKFALVTFIWVSPLYVFNLPSDYLFHYEYKMRPQISCLKGCKATLQIYILKGCVVTKVALVKTLPTLCPTTIFFVLK